MGNVIVIGAGMVGSAMAIDMSAKHSVCLADLSEENLQKAKKENPQIKTEILNVKDGEKLKKAIADYDLVICAVPGFLGYETLEKIILAGKDVVDISFFPENSLKLNQLAIKNNVCAVVDCGVAPGMGNLILGKHNAQMQVDNFLCMVGGLPKKRVKPFEYKAPFSPIDVIEEYTRTARYVENGNLVSREALSDPEIVEFDEIGSLEAFNTDGLRSLVYTMSHIPNMKEKTLRYPGHIDLIKNLKMAGFFEDKEIELNGIKIRPIDFSSKILIDNWKLLDEEEEFTVMKIEISGVEDHRQVKHTYNLLDYYDRHSKKSSMARTTGYTATSIANAMLEGKIKQKGILPPELIGSIDGLLDYVFEYLSERGVNYSYSKK